MQKLGAEENLQGYMPNCTCESDKRLSEYNSHCRQEYIKHSLARFNSLKLGAYHFEYDTKPPRGWESAVEMSDKGRSLLLHGPSGCFKTTALKRVALDLCLGRKIVRGGYVPSILKKLKNFDDDVDNYYELLSDAEVLVLDDLDKLLGTQYEVERLLALVNHFSAMEKTMLITMNTDLEKFRSNMQRNQRNIPSDWIEAFISRLMQNADIRLVSGVTGRATTETL